MQLRQIEIPDDRSNGTVPYINGSLPLLSLIDHNRSHQGSFPQLMCLTLKETRTVKYHNTDETQNETKKALRKRKL